MELRVDLHCHGPNKWLGTERWNPMDLAKLVAGKLDVCAITEMRPGDNRFEDLKKSSLIYEKDGRVEVRDDEIYIPEYDVLFLRTQEIPTWENVYSDWRKNDSPEGHVLVVGAKNKIKEESLDNVLEQASEQNAAVILDHPFAGPQDYSIGACYSNSFERINKYFEEGKIHAIEDSGQLRSKGFLATMFGYNGANNDAIDFAKENNYNLVANSDAHSVREMGLAHTLFYVINNRREFNVKDIVKTLRRENNGEIIPIGVPGPLFSLEKHGLELSSAIIKEKLVGK